MKPYFDLLAAYNAWANERIYEAASRLSDDEYRADRGVFFKSLHGTLNHLLVADRIWLRRFTGTGEAPNCPIYIDGEHVTTLRGTYEELSSAFQRIVDEYVERTYGRR